MLGPIIGLITSIVEFGKVKLEQRYIERMKELAIEIDEMDALPNEKIDDVVYVSKKKELKHVIEAARQSLIVANSK